jgi:hypothetical protein
LLDSIAATLNPIHDQIFQTYPTSYYWSTFQSEWAIDLTFRTAQDLHRLYPRLLQHDISTFGSTDVMRFLGRRLPLSGQIPARFSGQVVSDLQARQEGVRVKHRLNANSVKLYDKAFTSVGNVLRAEGTINDVSDFRAFRPKAGDPGGTLAWRPPNATRRAGQCRSGHHSARGPASAQPTPVLAWPSCPCAVTLCPGRSPTLAHHQSR